MSVGQDVVNACASITGAVAIDPAAIQAAYDKANGLAPVRNVAAHGLKHKGLNR